MSIRELVDVLYPTRAVLFDFDGPVCSVFAGYPAPQVAEEMRDRLAELDVPITLPSPDRDDPIEVLRFASGWSEQAARTADDIMTAAETTAAQTAEPTPGGRLAMERTIATGRRVAVVSNNSEASIRAYLDLHGMNDLVSAIVGRPYATPHGMKPHPRILHDVLMRLRLGPDSVVLIGDSLTDIQAARYAHISSIGYANRPGKDAVLADADAVIDDMNDIAAALDKLTGDAG